MAATEAAQLEDLVPDMSNIILRKNVGESIDFEFDRGGLSIQGWVCTITVKKFPDDAALLTRVVPASGDGWPGFLTTTETTALGEGRFRLIGTLVNAGTDQEEKIANTTRFNLSNPW